MMSALQVITYAVLIVHLSHFQRKVDLVEKTFVQDVIVSETLEKK